MSNVMTEHIAAIEKAIRAVDEVQGLINCGWDGAVSIADSLALQLGYYLRAEVINRKIENLLSIRGYHEVQPESYVGDSLMYGEYVLHQPRRMREGREEYYRFDITIKPFLGTRSTIMALIYPFLDGCEGTDENDWSGGYTSAGNVSII